MDPVTPETALDRFPGKTLDGFLIEQFLGRGGMAAVFRARDISLNRPVALKVLRSQAVRDDATRTRFLDEARAAASLHHRNIVEIWRAGETAGVLYMAMPYVQGRTLEKVLRQEKSLPFRRALHIARQVAHALEAAHAAGLAHRDIKPANIMIGPDGHVTVMDFGVARPVAGEVTDGTEFAGTPEYASPEQHTGSSIDGRSDLWSLGVTLYQMLTGHLPFVAATPSELRIAIATESPIAVRDLAPDVPSTVERLVNSLMSRNPAQRPASARATIRAIDGARRRATWRIPAFAATAALLIAGAAVAAHQIRAWRPAESPIKPATIVRGTTTTATPAVEPRPESPPIPAIPSAGRPTILLADFSGPEGDADWIRTALPDLINRELASSGRVTMLPKSHSCTELASAPDFESAAAAAARTHGADAVLGGSYDLQGDRIHVSLCLVRPGPAGPKTVRFQATATRRDFSTLVRPLCDDVLKSLEPEPVKPVDPVRPEGS